jgi:hypothetical protein
MIVQLREFRKHLWHKRFLQYRQTPMSVAAALSASTCERVAVLPREVLRARSHRAVNTSLSGTLFF